MTFDPLFETPYSIVLQFRHPSRGPDDVGAALGMDAVAWWGKGDLVTTSDGQLGSRRHEENLWGAIIDGVLEIGSKRDALADAIAIAVDRLEPAGEFIRQYVGEGGRCLVTVYWRICESLTDDSLPHTLIARLANLKIDLEIAQWFGPDEETK